MENPRAEIAERLRQVTNILVIISRNPSVDQLSAAIGLTLLLNKLDKHATAIFSGQTPSTIEFLQPEKTFEKNADSLRDFIVALDKAKADHLRYKIEDKMVKIFITPYRTSLSEKDLIFSQGDFNVEVVLALGIEKQQDLDRAISSHGRILHDATVIGIGAGKPCELGAINWFEQKASSLCEMIYSLGQELKKDVIDSQIATAFLTGIVSETNRFSNEKTTPQAMQLSSQLMAAGANQQLVANQLQKSIPLVNKTEETKEEGDFVPDDRGLLQIPHIPAADKPAETKPHMTILPPDHGAEKEENAPANEIHISEEGEIQSPSAKKETKLKLEAPPASTEPELKLPPKKPLPSIRRKQEKMLVAPSQTDLREMALEPPEHGGQLTSNTEPEGLDPSTDVVGGGKADIPLLNRDDKDKQKSSPSFANKPLTSAGAGLDELPEIQNQEAKSTLSQLETKVNSPHLNKIDSVSPLISEKELSKARDAIKKAVAESDQDIPPPPADLPIETNEPAPSSPTKPAAPVVPIFTTPAVNEQIPGTLVDNTTSDPGLPTNLVTSDPGLPPGLVPSDPGLPPDNTAASGSPAPPPPVPPPIMPLPTNDSNKPL